MHRLLHRLRRSEAGTATIEFALIGSTFALMLVGVVDITTAYNRKMELEQALQRSLEKIMNTTTLTTPTQTIKNEVIAAVEGIEPSDIVVDYVLECDMDFQDQSESVPTETDPEFTEEPDVSAKCDEGEIQRRYVTATVTDQFEPFFPIAGLGASGTAFTITAKAGMRVE
jgi:Flp pilus assembly pilin Flp